MIRNYIATTALNTGRTIGRTLGCELAVELNGQHIKTSMRVPGSGTGYAWDPHLYAKGQLFYEGYSNGIKPFVDIEEGVTDLDKVDLMYTDAGEEDVEDGVSALERAYTGMMSSKMYQLHMDNHMGSELLQPNKLLSVMVKALAGVGLLVVLFGLVDILIATGVM